MSIFTRYADTDWRLLQTTLIIRQGVCVPHRLTVRGSAIVVASHVAYRLICFPCLIEKMV